VLLPAAAAQIVDCPQPSTDPGQVRGSERGRLGDLGDADGTFSTSAWNCISQRLAVAAPSARSSLSSVSHASSIARTASTVW